MAPIKTKAPVFHLMLALRLGKIDAISWSPIFHGSNNYGYLWCLVEIYFTLMLQAVGIIAAVGDSVTNLKIGTPAAVMTFGSYAEFIMVHYLERHCFLLSKIFFHICVRYLRDST